MYVNQIMTLLIKATDHQYGQMTVTHPRFLLCRKRQSMQNIAMPAQSADRTSRLLYVALLILAAWWPTQSEAFLTTSSDAIRSKLVSIQAELDSLPDPVPCAMPWTMGFRSKPLSSPTERHEIEILFPGTNAVDLVVLMPAAYTENGSDLKPFGFPDQFFIERMLPDGSSEIIADHRETAYRVLGVEPQLFPCPDAKPTVGIRITTTRTAINQDINKVNDLMALGEAYAFEGPQNVALNTEVKSTNLKWIANIWEPKCLVDGFSMFSPATRRHHIRDRDYQAFTDQIVLHIDLGSIQPVDELRLWPVMAASDDNMPYTCGVGFPTDILLERLDSPNDSSPRTLYKSNKKLLRPGLNPFSQRLPSVTGRFFRLTLSHGFPDFRPHSLNKIALSEIELLFNDRALTRGLPPSIDIINPTRTRPSFAKEKTLTNGLSSEGKILPLRQWLQQFSRQRELTRLQAALQTDLELALRQEKERTGVLIAAAFVLIIILALMICVVRLLASRRWAQMREQIASDLHDEVGANLSSIAHSTELIRELIPEPTAIQSELLDDAITTARTTARDTRQFIRFLEQRDTSLDTDSQIRKIAAQILGPIEHSCNLTELRAFNQLAPIRQWDFFFFLKESLNNIIKHAEADHVCISTHRDGPRIQLIVEDNGRGIPPDRLPLHHLQNRAKRLKGDLEIKTAPDRGTQIILTLTQWKKS